VKWITNVILVATLFWLTGYTGNVLAQEGTTKTIDSDSFAYRMTSVARGTGQGKKLATFCEEMSSEELEAVTGGDPGDVGQRYLSARIIFGDEIDVEQASGFAFHNGGCSSLNTQMNSLIAGTQ
jgi:hypothetical protein